MGAGDKGAVRRRRVAEWTSGSLPAAGGLAQAVDDAALNEGDEVGLEADPAARRSHRRDAP